MSLPIARAERPLVPNATAVVARLAYRPEEAAQLLGIGRSYAFELFATGELRSFKVGRRRLVSAEALVEFIRERECA